MSNSSKKRQFGMNIGSASILHGIYVALQREVRFRQILCLDDSMVLIYCLCAQQMGLGKQLDTDGAGQGEKQDRYDHFH